ncbi:sialate O-acetylesterase [Flavivirga abyssicola]|uniref:sialate O-acetylesterase n=1 Tax=Flavivirga abyssicola TaxID=3063533 RepID=UPI0026DEF336|nr:sialate O-acetylesterase [Flavivirga sp. MEBiC07777]WVK13762.1 sialate O-acetylesterase [Flavivirga sp. MEBiC07777]
MIVRYKNKLFFLFVCVLCISLFLSFNLKDTAAQTNDKKDIHVVLLAGQSNMVGHGNYSALSYDIKKRIEKVSNRVLLSTSDNPKKQAEPLSYYVAVSDKYSFDMHFGPELLLGLTLAEANPNQYYLLIKKAVGGTSLYGAWNPEWTTEKANLAERGAKRKNLRLFESHILNIKNNLNMLEKTGQSYKVIGLGWLQGESDTNKEITASNYKINLNNLVTSYRKTLSLDNLPIVIGQVNPLSRKFKEGPELVRAAMEAVAEGDDYIEIIKTSTNADWLDYPKHSDNLHYNTEGQKRLGIAFGKALINLCNKK